MNTNLNTSVAQPAAAAFQDNMLYRPDAHAVQLEADRNSYRLNDNIILAFSRNRNTSR